MITKSPSKSGSKTRVTFRMVPDEEAETVAVLGEFNGWNPETHRLAKRKDGSFSTTVSLDADRSYRFRYLVDGAVWANDEGADSFAPNRFGGQDGVLEL